MREYEFDRESALEKGEAFPDEVCDDPWVVYHGTSSVSEEEIDLCGFHWRPAVATRSEVGHVVSMFDRMSWAGRSGGGYVVLRPFSLDYDFAGGDQKSIFFAECSNRALLYATRGFAGGETARALRFAFTDLEEYLKSPDLRHSHMEDLRQEYDHHRGLVAAVGNPPAEINLEWLHSELSKLKELRTRCWEAFERYSHGVVYAVRFDERDLGLLKYNSFMGIEALNAILPEKIIAKVRVPSDWEYVSDDRQRMRVIFGNGVVGRLSSERRPHAT